MKTDKRNIINKAITRATMGLKDHFRKTVFEPADAYPYWRLDGEKCRAFWKANKASCSTCIAVCPGQKVLKG